MDHVRADVFQEYKEGQRRLNDERHEAINHRLARLEKFVVSILIFTILTLLSHWYSQWRNHKLNAGSTTEQASILGK